MRGCWGSGERDKSITLRTRAIWDDGDDDDDDDEDNDNDNVSDGIDNELDCCRWEFVEDESEKCESSDERVNCTWSLSESLNCRRTRFLLFLFGASGEVKSMIFEFSDVIFDIFFGKLNWKFELFFFLN